MEYTDWTPAKICLPNESDAKLVTIKKGNLYYCAVARFETDIQKWILNNKKMPADLEVRAWMDIPGVYLE